MGHTVHTCHVLQGGFQFEGGERTGREHAPFAVRVIAFFQIFLDFLPPVGCVIDVYVRQGGVAARNQTLIDKAVDDGQGCGGGLYADR